ncbi:hypothetical protein SAMN05444008_12431 [Cnuella takakiae]|uniref:Beta-lactamase-inhibitor-like, PepSY-like n=1 Tax=Cnuella takakiae TaxID=1302690 RepID=A0A1M5IKD9_9BACT|nr:hypothetical protein [Cnuella takakiae]OLY92220.1 hypothetical protein BUE76_10205 [Cnuella takakiae]SHG28824.1 hypothetical protein SAMN05444008_12431 [Cnuella takakiae]
MKCFNSLRNIAAVLLLAVSAQAQTSSLPPQTASVSTPAANTFVANDAATLDGLKLRNEKLFKSFTSQFRNVSDISIYPEENKTIFYCMVDGIRNNILYTNKGRLVHTVRYYEASLLPKTVTGIIEDAFPGYELKTVSEVTVDGRTAYLVSIENKRKFKTVRVVNDDWDIYNEFDKQQ